MQNVIKINFLDLHLHSFSTIFGVVSDEHYEIFHKEILAKGEMISGQAEPQHVRCPTQKSPVGTLEENKCAIYTPMFLLHV